MVSQMILSPSIVPLLGLQPPILPSVAANLAARRAHLELWFIFLYVCPAWVLIHHLTDLVYAVSTYSLGHT